MKLVFPTLLISILFSSCIVLHSGNVSSGPLIGAYDRRVSTISGEASSTYVFGIGDVSKDKLVQQATDNLYKKRPLHAGEYYSNFICDISHKFIFGIVLINKVTVTASVLKAGSEAESIGEAALDKPDSKPVKVSRAYFINQIDSFALGETVFYEARDGSVRPYIINSIDEEVTLGTKDSKKTIQVPLTEPLFSTKKKKDGFAVGDTVQVRLFLAYDNAMIRAMSNERAVFAVGGEYFVRKLRDIKN